MGMKDAVERLAELKARKAEMGGTQRVERQHGRGKLDARQRLALLFDPGSVQELGMLAAAEGRLPSEEDPARPTAADGVITAFGTVEGRPVAAAVYDFTVLGGTIGEVGERKVTRLRDLALKDRTAHRLAGGLAAARGSRPAARSIRGGWPASPTPATCSASSRCSAGWCPRSRRCSDPARPGRRTSRGWPTTCRW